MKLVIDANILVGELLRERGKAMMQSSQYTLYAAENVLSETLHELRKRVEIIVNQRQMPEAVGQTLLIAAEAVIAEYIQLVAESEYSYLELESRNRIPRDPDDWHTVALALHLEAAIWTRDCDFLGCGCPTWTTETLLLRSQS